MSGKDLRNPQEVQYAEAIERHFNTSTGSFAEKMQAFPRFVSRQQQAIYLYKWELFQKILNVHGSILEFGVYMGSGLFTFASFSTMLEPYNYQRRVIGFDTFTGFPDYSQADLATGDRPDTLREGGFGVATDQYEQLREAIDIFDLNRPLGHVAKLELVRGDVRQSIPDYLEHNPHLLISLLYLDLDLYEPTKLVLELLYDRLVPGGIVAFDEINNPRWPGETRAYLEFFKGRSGRLEKLPFEPLRCFFVKE
jgi:SAM-dependent methyltransferase